MENEIITEIVPDVPQAPVETETDIPVPETLPDVEIVENVSPSVEDVSTDENIPDTPILEEEIPETNLDPETNIEINTENGDFENEIMENESESSTDTGNLSGNADYNVGSVSGNDVQPYTVNYYAETTETIPLWENNISNFSTSEMLLFLIFILLLVQFIHNIFKGSHWLKG